MIPISQMPRGCDRSKHNDIEKTPINVNWSLGRRLKMVFAYMRLLCNDTKDVAFDYNWEQSHRKGWLRGPYHYFEWIKDFMDPPEVQRANFFELIAKAGLTGQLKPAIDFERPNATWPELPSRETCLKYLEVFKNDDIVFYTNVSGLRHLMPIPDWLLSKDLWLAQPPYARGTTRMCTSFEEIPWDFVPSYAPYPNPTFWQVTFMLPGLQYGDERLYLDGDLFWGSQDELLQYCGLSQMPIPEPGETVIALGTVKAASGLNVRSAPVVGNNVLYSVQNYTSIEISEIRTVSNNTWIRWADSEHWSAARYNGTELVHIAQLDLVPEPEPESEVPGMEERVTALEGDVGRLREAHPEIDWS